MEQSSLRCRFITYSVINFESIARPQHPPPRNVAVLLWLIPGDENKFQPFICVCAGCLLSFKIDFKAPPVMSKAPSDILENFMPHEERLRSSGRPPLRCLLKLTFSPMGAPCCRLCSLGSACLSSPDDISAIFTYSALHLFTLKFSAH